MDERLLRSDIRADPASGEMPEGVPLELTFRVSSVDGDTCEPLSNAIVDIWQCDALGVYSDVRDTAGRFDTRGRKFLRGHQITDADGVARFTTIFPGWYEGRTVHIHFKIRTAAQNGRAYEFTSQLYFDDAFTDAVMRRSPYDGRGARRVRNAQDEIFRRGGDRLVLDVKPQDGGLRTEFAIGLQRG